MTSDRIQTVSATVRKLLEGVSWRVGAARERALIKAAQLKRGWLSKPQFVAITGSAGKTAAKDLMAGIFAKKFRGQANPLTENQLADVARTVLATGRDDDYCVMEMSANWPGYLDPLLDLFKPNISVVTLVRSDHLSAYHSREAVAAEKVKLVKALPRTGMAILNADDDLVSAMAAQCAGKVMTFGFASKADIRAEEVSAVWPDRMALTVVRGAERVRVNTQLCGPHWVPSVLAAVSVGIAIGLTLQECADAVACVQPTVARMQPVRSTDGVDFIRDDWKAPVWTLDACFDFMRSAKARRKITVIGTLSDYNGDASAQYVRAAKKALEVCDNVVFVGPWASRVLRARPAGREDALRAFTHVREASAYVNSIAQPGDLVLLKGTMKQDHLMRVIIARNDKITCWREDCKLSVFCDECPQRMIPSGPPLPNTQPAAAAIASLPATAPTPSGAVQVLVGLGNPKPDLVGTPHNVGYEALDRIAATISANWEAHGETLISRGRWKERDVCLVKLQTPMNLSGHALKVLTERIPFTPENCVLLHDDLDLPIGTIRTRHRGSAGGHRGVASILDAFQTDTFRRVKIGVGRAGEKVNAAEYVLAPFLESDREPVGKALNAAAERALALASGQKV